MDLFDKVALFERMVGINKVSQNTSQEAIRSLIPAGPGPDDRSVDNAIQELIAQLKDPKNTYQASTLVKSLAERLKGQNLSQHTDSLDALFATKEFRPYRQMFDGILGHSSAPAPSGLNLNFKAPAPVSQAPAPSKRTFELVKNVFNSYKQQLEALGPDAQKSEFGPANLKFRQLQDLALDHIITPLISIMDNVEGAHINDPAFMEQIMDLMGQTDTVFALGNRFKK